MLRLVPRLLASVVTLLNDIILVQGTREVKSGSIGFWDSSNKCDKKK